MVSISGAEMHWSTESKAFTVITGSEHEWGWLMNGDVLNPAKVSINHPPLKDHGRNPE